MTDRCLFTCRACERQVWIWAGMGDHASPMPPECLDGEPFDGLGCVCPLRGAGEDDGQRDGGDDDRHTDEQDDGTVREGPTHGD